MVKVFIIDGVEYNESNKRMRYNPEYHYRHHRGYTTSDLAYLCSMYESTKKADIAMALGRTHGSVLTMADTLRKNGTFEYYKKLGQRED